MRRSKRAFVAFDACSTVRSDLDSIRRMKRIVTVRIVAVYRRAREAIDQIDLKKI